ncbi:MULTISPECIES: hypothetical protein [unclassified Wolbachia]|nr:hypothetical protein [Wolbachia endosymbiont of Ceratitis capitata]MBS9528754.1 hypothetical protein [Wolbachia endosymbiont of Ceratitis capitata]
MHNLSRKKANSYYSSKFTDTVMQVAPSPVIRVADTGSFMTMSSKCQLLG